MLAGIQAWHQRVRDLRATDVLHEAKRESMWRDLERHQIEALPKGMGVGSLPKRVWAATFPFATLRIPV